MKTCWRLEKRLKNAKWKLRHMAGIKRYSVLLVLVFCFIWGVFFTEGCLAQSGAVEFGGEVWDQIKGRHFVVYYPPGGDEAGAGNLLRAAEEYYQTIGDLVGFTRYADYWTWDKRAKIFLFPDQSSFTARTGAPAWSKGYAGRDMYMFQSRAIVTYQQEEGVLQGLLPHEISHLVLHDFIPSGNLPVWIDEGIAQLYEKDKYAAADGMMRAFVARGQHVSFDFLNQWDIRRETDQKKVEVFYAQSLSVIRFLRDQYGDEGFRRFCRNLRDGKTVDEALRSAYPAAIRSLHDLEQRWLMKMKNIF